MKSSIASLWVADSQTITTCLDVRAPCVADSEWWGRKWLGAVGRGSFAVILDTDADVLHGVFTIREAPRADATRSPFGARYPFFAPLDVPASKSQVPNASGVLRDILGKDPRAGELESGQWESIDAHLRGPGTGTGHDASWNNQGRVRANNPGRIEHEGLRFRTIEERFLYGALVELGLWVAPLAVFASTSGRIEPDLVVLDRGATYVIEVDGSSHGESPLRADQRLRPFRESGWLSRRVPSGACSSPQEARKCARRILESLRAEADGHARACARTGGGRE